jgi:monovalent cation:H+ antiporter-2, CPA2 family
MISIIAASEGGFPPVFTLLALVLISVVVVSLLLSRFRQSLLVGYFLCGVVLGNSGMMDWMGINDTSAISALSEIGIVLLLFTIGIEFSFKELKALKRPVFVGGGVQVGLTVLCAFLIAIFFGLNWSTALILGFGFSLSSTAVCLKTFQDLGLPESPQARVALGMSIFQDIMAILFMVLIPSMAGSEGLSGVGLAAVKGLLFLAGVVVLSRYGLPQMLDSVARTRSRELFTVTVIGICAAVALVSAKLGLSAALGAFAAGVVVSESIYSHRVLADVLPFKDLFLTVFFVSVGLLLQTSVIFSNFAYIAVMVMVILLVKGIIAGFAAYLSGLKHNTWILTAAALASTGEFSIVLFDKAFHFELISDRWEQIILASTALSMALVPSLMKWGLKYSRKVRKQKSSKMCRWEEQVGVARQIKELEGHIIICGYGPVGQNLHRNLELAHIPVVVIEMNPDTVKSLLNQGLKALFADARDPYSMELAKLDKALGVAITFPNVAVASSLAKQALEVKPDILLYARCKFANEVEILKSSGVHHVMLDEEQSGRAMIRSVMLCYVEGIEETWEI